MSQTEKKTPDANRSTREGKTKCIQERESDIITCILVIQFFFLKMHLYTDDKLSSDTGADETEVKTA